MKNDSGFFQELLSGIFARKRKFKNIIDERPLVELCDALIAERGEISSINIATMILNKYRLSSKQEKLQFFTALATNFDLDANKVVITAKNYQTDNSAKNLTALRNASEPRRMELFRRLNQVPGATEQLVSMRADLLNFLPENPDFKKNDVDMERLFTSWFNRGFLVLRHIDWSTSADILEKIISYEAVHEISDWDDLRRRLQPSDRRCFAFFHPSMPTEPLIFVEVALCDGIASSIQKLLQEDRKILNENETRTAVFYSISNCQRGLKGVSFGNFLIKQVAKDLSASLPNLNTFVTLSPVPTFMRWLGDEAKAKPNSSIADFHTLISDMNADALSLQNEDFQNIALNIASYYFLKVKRADLQPVDPVTRFHLGNGASLKQLNWLGDISDKGLKQSAGLMVNYHYDLAEVEARHEAYAHDYEVTAVKEIQVRSEKSNSEVTG